MQLKCRIGSLRLNDGTDYSEGDVFSLDDEKTVQSLLRSGYVQETEEQREKQIPTKIKNKSFEKVIK